MTLLQMSVFGAVIIGVIVCVRAVALYRLPKNILLFLWGIALTRLLAPYSLPCVYSVYSLLERYQRFSSQTANAYPALIQNAETYSILSNATMEIPTINASQWTQRIKIVWLIGVCVCAGFFAIAYLKCRREFREALPLSGENEANSYIQNWVAEKNSRRLFLRRSITVRQFDRISTPLTYGIFHPVILLPARHMNWNDETALEYVLTHEYTHIYYQDAVLKLIIILTLCAHWFNPMVWVLYILANRDIELRCDEAVIRSLGGKRKSDYAMALILMAEQNNGFQPLCSRFSRWYLFGKNNARAMRVMEERIKAIMKMKKLSLSAGIMGAVLCVGITTAFATSALPAPIQQENVAQNENGETLFISESSVKAADFKEYEPFGLKFDEKTKVLSYQNKRVRYFYDGAQLEDNCTVTRLEYADAERKGDIDVHAVRQREENGDGSYNVLGKLISLEIDAPEVFQNRYFVSADLAVTSAKFGEPVTEKFDSIEKAYTVTGEVTKTATETDDDITITVNAQSEATTDAVSEVSEDISSKAPVTVHITDHNDATKSTGMTLEEKFQQYEKYGVRYEASTDGSAGNVYYNNQLARSFADISPNGSAFSFASEAESDIRIQTVYDANGNLTGVKQIN